MTQRKNETHEEYLVRLREIKRGTPEKKDVTNKRQRGWRKATPAKQVVYNAQKAKRRKYWPSATKEAKQREWQGRMAKLTEEEKEARRALHRKQRATERERFKKYNLTRQLKKYGITSEEFELLCRQCGGKCPICHCELVFDGPKGNPRKAAIDHDHDTNEVRGILCVRCNLGIGQLGDDPAAVQRAADYLKSFYGRAG